MTVRAPFVVFALVMASSIGLETAAVRSEPIKVSGPTPSLSPNRLAAEPSWKATPVALAGDASRTTQAFVTTARHRLDLSTLTMADFGDVEQSR